ncbi:MAG: DUF501 domain-containing protein [Pseudomonadota bacterium]
MNGSDLQNEPGAARLPVASSSVVISADVITQVHGLLGREPRGLRAIAVCDDQGCPMVIRVASLVDGKPFPTLFWLVDPALSLRLDREEAAGLIAEFQALVDQTESLRSQMVDDHHRHIRLRESYLSAAEESQLKTRGQWRALSERGIGGIGNFDRIRCLHTWYAAHLVEANTIGRLIDERWGRDSSQV